MSAPGGPSGGSHNIGRLLFAKTKAEAKSLKPKLPKILQSNWDRFLNHMSNKFKDFEVKHDGAGGYIFASVKPGNVPGSYAVYYKEVNAFGETTSAYKLTYDPNGNLIHRKDKF